MPFRRSYAPRSRPRRRPRRRLVSKQEAANTITKFLRDAADLRAGSAVQDLVEAHRRSAYVKGQKKLSQTGAAQRGSQYRGPYKAKHGLRKYKGRYSKMRTGGARKRLIGLNQGHRHKFKQHVTGVIVPAKEASHICRFPLKEYQKSEMKYYPHPIQQKILLLGNQAVIAGSDNVLSDKVDYEDFPTTTDKKLIATVYYPIVPPAHFSGIHSFTRMQVDANSEGFSKVSCLGRQNRCNEKYAYDSTEASSAITTRINNHVAQPDAILTGAFLRMTCQANRNFPVKITAVLVRMSNPAAIVSNQGITNDELVECANNMTHIDYDAAEIIFQQSKVLQPCKSEKFVHQEFDLGWTGYYKLTQQFKDETALTVKADQGGTYKYGQQGKAKIAGSQISQDQLSNRLVLFLKCKRLGDTQIGMATQTREFQESGFTKTIGLNQPVNQEDGDSYMSTVTGHLNVLPTDNYVGDELTSGSFRCKAQLTLNYAVKEGVRSVPTYVNSASNNGKTKILHASTYDSNYGTLNATLNVTD